MNVSQLSLDLINQLRSWFYAKDRAIVINRSIRAYNVPSGATMAMAMIQEQELSASVAGVTFSSIPQNFRSLMLITQTRTDRAAEADAVFLQFNGDVGNNYDYITAAFQTVGTTIAASRATSNISIGTAEASSSRANNFTIFSVLMPGYNLSDREKWAECSISGSFGNVSADADLFLIGRRGRWRDTSPITAIRLSSTGNFVAGSIFTLYGIL